MKLFVFSRRLAVASVVVCAPLATLAQSTGSVGIGTTTPAPSAALEIKSTSQGLLLPRLTLAQRTALTSSTTAPPVPGLVIYQTDNTPGLYAFDGSAWVRLSADNLGNHTATQNLDLGANRLVGNGGSSGLAISSSGRVGIGTSSPGQQLEVAGSIYANGESTGFLTDVGTAAHVGLLKYSGRAGGLWRTSTQDFEIGRVNVASLPGTPTSFTTDLYVSGNGRVGIGTRNPAASAALDITSTTQGLLPPRLTLAQRTALTSSTTAPPVAGLVIYQTDDAPGIYLYDGAAWTLLRPDNLGNHTATQNLNLADKLLVGNGGSSGLAISSSGRVGIGTSSPSQQLEVAGSIYANGENSGFLTDVGAAAHVGLLKYSGRAGGLWRTSAQDFEIGRVNVASLPGTPTTFTTDLYVSGNGRVGVGTKTPSFQLDVASTISLAGRLSSSNLDGTWLNLANTSAGGGGFQFISTGTNNSQGPNKLLIAQGIDGAATGSSLVLDGATGNLGVGTFTPSQRLEVAGAVYANGDGTGFLTDAGATARVGLLKYSGHEGGIWRTSAQDFEIGRVDVASLPGTPTSFTTDLYVSGSGQVGIGTQTPGFQLDVNSASRKTGRLSSNNLDGTWLNLANTSAGGGGFTFVSTGTNNVQGPNKLLIAQGIDGSTPGSDLVLDGATGNVGMGTYAPSQRLEVAGSIYANGENSGFLTDAGTTAQVGLLKYSGHAGGLWRTSTQDFEIGRVNVASLPGTPTSFTTDLYVSGSGQVGIGTKIPFARLDVESTSNLTERLNSSSPVGTWLNLTNTSVGGGGFQLISTGTDNIEGPNKLLLYRGTTGLSNGGGLVIDGATGNVGMGTYAPSQRLEVTGSVYANGEGAGFLTDVGTSAHVGLLKYSGHAGGLWRTSAQDFEIGRVNVASLPGTPTSFTTDLYVSGSGQVGIGTKIPFARLDVNGDIACTNVYSSSDARLKQQVRPLTGALAGVQALRGVRYTFRQADFPTRRLPGGEQLGLLAQEVEAVYPELVSTDAQGYKAVNYVQLTPVLLEAIKELAAQHAAQRQRADQAEAALTRFEARLQALEANGQRAAASSK